MNIVKVHINIHKKVNKMNEIVMTKTGLVEVESLDALYTNWVEFIDAKPKTVETYTRAIKQFIKYCTSQGITSIEDITTQDIKAYREALKQEHKASTVQAYIMAVKQFYKWLEENTPLKNVAKNVKGMKQATGHKKDALTPAQVKMLLETCDTSTPNGLRDYAILTLILTCGLRTIEVIRANVEDLRPYGNTTALYVQGKGHDEKDEPIKVAEVEERILREYLKSRTITDNKEPLFTSLANKNKGQRLTTKSISRITAEHLKQAGLKSEFLTAHSLRHTAITQALEKGATLQETKQFARHSSINTTLIYAHNLDKKNNPCSSLIADALL